MNKLDEKKFDRLWDKITRYMDKSKMGFGEQTYWLYRMGPCDSKGLKQVFEEIKLGQVDDWLKG